MPSIAIIGASSNREKFSNKCVRAYLEKGWTVFPVHPKETEIEGHQVFGTLGAVTGKLDRIAMYLGPAHGLGVLDEVAKRAGAELILNPGTESPEVLDKCKSLSINARQACAIRDIGADPDAL